MQPQLPEWESQLIDEAIATAQERLEAERAQAHRRAIQLAREQAYHRLAVAIDGAGRGRVSGNQLTLFGSDPTLFDLSDEAGVPGPTG
ncbi:MAG: hypothetical protein ACRDJB_04675 [Actinomycetota bacterium]